MKLCQYDGRFEFGKAIRRLADHATRCLLNQRVHNLAISYIKFLSKTIHIYSKRNPI